MWVVRDGGLLGFFAAAAAVLEVGFRGSTGRSLIAGQSYRSYSVGNPDRPVLRSSLQRSKVIFAWMRLLVSRVKRAHAAVGIMLGEQVVRT
jgi:hypothetical protein